MDLLIDPKLQLPEKFKEWRAPQKSAFDAIVDCQKEFFLADLPTGIGKSALGIAAHKELGNRCIYLCGTKQLQNQIALDFGEYAVTLKGKRNYPCAMRIDNPDVTAEDCNFDNPSNCDYFYDCEYYQQRAIARAAPFVVLNYAYYLNEVNGF